MTYYKLAKLFWKRIRFHIVINNRTQQSPKIPRKGIVFPTPLITQLKVYTGMTKKAYTPVF